MSTSVKEVFFSLFISLSIAAAAAECGLRIFPQLIPMDVLSRFPEAQRRTIAKRLNLPTESDLYQIPRDDGGPPLYLYEPHSTLMQPIDPEDAKYGGTSFNTPFDQDGFCSIIGKEKPLEKYDIIALGDSFTWCTTVLLEQTWPAQLADLSGLSAYNMGRCCIGLYEYLQIFKNFGLRYRPDYAIFAIYQGNDLRDAEKFFKFRSKPQSDPPIYVTAADAYKNFLKRFYIYNYVNSFLSNARKKESINFRYRVFAGSNWVNFNITNTDLDEVRYGLRLAANEINLNLFDEGLNGIVKVTADASVKLILIYIPSAYSSFENVKFADESISKPMASFAIAQKNYFAAFAKKNSISFIDITPAFVDFNRKGSGISHLPANVHLSPAGHRVIAEVITKEISQDILTKKKTTR